jgi:hypothetical protein
MKSLGAETFAPVKRAIRFAAEGEMQERVVQQFMQHPKEFFVVGIHQLVHWWDSVKMAVVIFFQTITIPLHVSIVKQVSVIDAS